MALRECVRHWSVWHQTARLPVRPPKHWRRSVCIASVWPLRERGSRWGKGTNSAKIRQGRESMRAVVWHGVGDISLDNVPEPKLEQSTDAIVRITTSAICGTDLHFIRGTVPNMTPGQIIGHEGVGIVEEVGR